MPEGRLSEVSLTLVASPARSCSLPSPFSSWRNKLATSIRSSCVPGSQAPLLALRGRRAHRWVAGAGLRCNLAGPGFWRLAVPVMVSLVWPPGPGFTEICCGDFSSALQGKKVPQRVPRVSQSSLNSLFLEVDPTPTSLASVTTGFFFPPLVQLTGGLIGRHFIF